MKLVIQHFLLLCLLLIVACAQAQEKTMNTGKKNTERDVASKNKIMLIPFENKMYLSEIDAKINQLKNQLILSLDISQQKNSDSIGF